MKSKEGGSKIDFSFKVALVSAILVSFLPLISPFKLSGSTLHITLLALVAALGGAGYYLSYFSSQGHVEAGTASVLGNTYTPVVIILSTIFLGESLHGLQILGTILLLISAVIVSKKHKVGKVAYDKYFWLMISSGIWLAVLLVASRALLKVTGLVASVVIIWWTVCLALGIINLFEKQKTTFTRKEIVITGFFKSIQDLYWAFLTLLVANLSLASSITTFKVVVIFVVAALFLKEREDIGRKIIGSIIAIAGLVLMTI